jgi:hypothetical protein
VVQVNVFAFEEEASIETFKGNFQHYAFAKLIKVNLTTHPLYTSNMQTYRPRHVRTFEIFTSAWRLAEEVPCCSQKI